MRLTAGQSGFFDTVRGGGCLYVALAHTLTVFGLPYPQPLAVVGYAVVGSFFVLGGFLIHRAFLRHDVRSFARSRTLRLLPPFGFAIALTVVLAAVAPLVFASGSSAYLSPTAREAFSLDYLASTIIFVNGLAGGTLSANGPLWNVAVDVWLYFIAGLCLAGGRWRWLSWAFLAVIVARAPAYVPYMLAWAAGWGWSVLHLRGRLPVPSWRFAPLERAAPWSYALYITHFPLLLFCYGAWGERPWTAPLAFAATVGLAAVFGPAIERSGPTLWAWWRADNAWSITRLTLPAAAPPVAVHYDRDGVCR